MDQATHSKIVSLLWESPTRGKYPDFILPMCVLRRRDAVLEATKRAALEEKELLDAAGTTEHGAVLCDKAQQAFYNASKFTLKDLRVRGNWQLVLDLRASTSGGSK